MLKAIISSKQVKILVILLMLNVDISTTWYIIPLNKRLYKAIPAKADITNLEEIGQAICTLHETFGHIDLAIACAGTGEINAALDYAVERPTIDTNVVGWTFVIDMLYHIFERQGCGYLVAITSAGGLRGEPMAPAYSATKAYQINYMEALRKKAFKNGGHIILQIFVQVLLIQLWQKEKDCFG